MTCYTHGTAAVGICTVCSRGICRGCVAADAPRLVCAACARGGALGYEYRSETTMFGLPLVHIAFAQNPVTGRPVIARGVIAIGNIAYGGLAVGGAAFGLLTFGGLSIGLLGALGGAAAGLGLSVGGFAAGSVAIGGAAFGLQYALGGLAVAPNAIGATRCDAEAVEFFRQWLGRALTSCR